MIIRFERKIRDMRKYLSVFILFFAFVIQSQNLSIKGMVQFTSTAPQEIITARSTKLSGLINPSEQTFAFSIEINSFDGFNSPLQKIHFNENYMESNKYPKATFYGRIIEHLDINKVMDQKIRAKAYLEIHGIKKERIIAVDLKRVNGELLFTSDFILSLADYKISIPRIVHQKLSDQIAVHVSGIIQNPNP